jgi:hypothetical protein
VRIIAALVATTMAAHAQSQMEQCSYDTKKPDGTIGATVERPSIADGSNRTRFADIAKKEDAGEEGWRDYYTFNVHCRPLDNEKLEYNLFVQTHNGHVSLQHGLTENACYYTLSELRDGPWRGCGTSGCMRIVQDSDFERGECFK